MNESIVLPLDKKKTALFLIGALFFVLAALYCVVNPESIVSPIMRSPIIIRGFGVAGVIFFGLCFIFIAYKLFDHKPGLIIDELGITDNTSASSVGLIEWNDITGIEQKHVMSTKFLIIHTNNPEKYILGAKGVILKQLLKMNYRTYGSPLSITFSSIKTDVDKLERLLKNELNERASKR